MTLSDILKQLEQAVGPEVSKKAWAKAARAAAALDAERDKPKPVLYRCCGQTIRQSESGAWMIDGLELKFSSPQSAAVYLRSRKQ